MIELENRTILNDGTVICSESAAINILYLGRDLKNVIIANEDIVTQYNRATSLLDQSFEQLISSTEGIFENCDWYSSWFTPEPWADLNVEEYCLVKCTTDYQRNQVMYEMKLFEERKMLPVLKHLIWMVDHFRKHKIVWGVGRGSAVSSYVLFLIGINRIDPLKYNLDVREFLR